MKKAVFACAVMAVMTVLFAGTAFAGEWKHDNAGWWYQNDDGSCQQNKWFQDTDGKYYYFNTSGYMLTDTTTPDGYQVGADGAWISGGTSSASEQTNGNDLMAYIGTSVNDFVGAHSGFSLAGGSMPIYSGDNCALKFNTDWIITSVQVLISGGSFNIAGIKYGDSLEDTKAKLAAQGWTDEGRVPHMQLYWMQRGDGMIIRFWVNGDKITTVEAATSLSDF